MTHLSTVDWFGSVMQCLVFRQDLGLSYRQWQMKGKPECLKGECSEVLDHYVPPGQL